MEEVFQLTTSRRGRQQAISRYYIRFLISTHDLTKRSTKRTAEIVLRRIFQLTTSRRGRRKKMRLIDADALFQLTTSRRGRRRWCWGENLYGKISTHDLTKRSTKHLDWWNRVHWYFNSRPHEEVDVISLVDIFIGLIFQLTTSRRGRRQFLRKKFSFPNYFLCLLHIIYSYYINTIFFSTLFFAKSSFFLVRIH